MSNEPSSIDIHQVLDIVLSRKWFIVGLVLLCTVLALVFSLLQEKRYVVYSTLEIGRYQVSKSVGLGDIVFSGRSELKNLESHGETKARYMAWAKVLANREKYRDLGIETEDDFDVDIMSETMVQPRLSLQRTELGLELMNALNDKVLQDHERILSSLRQPGRREVLLRNSGSEPRLVEGNQTLGAKGVLKGEGGVPAGASGAQNASVAGQTEGEALAEERDVSGDDLHSRVISPPTYEEDEQQSSPLRNGALAFVVSFVFALALVFVHHIYRAYRFETRG